MGISAYISARVVLWLMVFTGFAINYMVRININIAIVSMVRQRSPASSSISAECERNISYTEEMTAWVNNTLQIQNDSLTFDWDEQEQNLILGSFYWTMWITQLPGGLLAQRYGAKRIFGFMQFLSVLPNFLIPFSVTWGFEGIIIIRLFQGIVNGFTWPSMHPLLSQWVPPNERSKFVSAYLGSSFGSAVAYPIYALVSCMLTATKSVRSPNAIFWVKRTIYVAASTWEAVFHFTGIAGIIWFIAWWLLVFDTPRKHPRISERELAYIERKLGTTVQHRSKLPTPWFSILTSMPVWACTLSQFGAMWGLFTLLIQAPTYFKFIHGFGIQMTGILSGVPHLSRSIFSIVFSVLADYLLKKKIFGLTAVRKFATLFGVVLAGFCTLGLAFMGCNAAAAVVLLTMATALNGAISSGALAATVDLSPNFSGAVFGVVSLISTLPGFISPAIVGFLTYENQNSSQWQIVFLISAVIQVATGFFFIVFGSSETQSWNSLTSNKSPDINLSHISQNSSDLEPTARYTSKIAEE